MKKKQQEDDGGSVSVEKDERLETEEAESLPVPGEK